MHSQSNNRTMGCSFEGCGTHIYVTAVVLLAVIATLANLAVIVVVYRNKNLHRRPALVLLCILSAIHFLSAVVITPIKASIVISHDER